MSAAQAPGPDAKKPRPRTPDIPGATKRMLDHWFRRGYLRLGLEFPDRPAGRGNRRTWTDEEERVATDMARLRAAGYTLDGAARVARVGAKAVEAALAVGRGRQR